MNRIHQSLAIFALALFGLWGCARGPATTSSPANAEKIKALEEKNSKVEEELRLAVSTREQFRKRMIAAEDVQARLRQDLQQETEKVQTALRDAEELKGQIKQRTEERDHVQNQYESFRKNLRELLAQADARMPGKSLDPSQGSSTPAPNLFSVPAPMENPNPGIQ